MPNPHTERKSDDQKDKQAARSDSDLSYAQFLTTLGVFAVLVTGGLVYVSFLSGWITRVDSPTPIQFFIVNLFSLMVLSAVIFQAFVYWKQWGAMKQTLQQTQRQADVAHDSLVKLQRPFIFVDSTSFRNHRDLGRDKDRDFWFSFYIVLTNNGTTPTQNFTIRMNSYFGDTPLPKNFAYGFDDPPFPYFFGPKASLTFPARALTDEDLIAVQNQLKHYYVWGECLYRDIFDGTPVHVTRFCKTISVVRGNPKNPRGEEVEISLSFHGAYNSAD